jgi:hypothetical protein
VHLQASPLLLVGVIGGVISTVAIVISGILASQPFPPPGGGNGGPPPPPPPNTALVVLIIAAAFFVTSWVTVAVAIARDQILQRMAATAASPSEIFIELHAWMEEMRAEAAADRATQMKDLMTQLDAFADQRETEGYLNAMRAAAGAPATNSDVRFLRKVPPPPEG